MNRGRQMTAVAAAATLLAGSALFAVFDSPDWAPAVLGVVVAVAVGGEVGRRLPVPPVLGSLVSVLTAGGYVFAVFARDTLIGGLLPGSRAVQALGDLSDQGFADVRALAAPVPVNRGLLLLTVAGVGLVAVAVDLLAAGARHPSLAGIPLLALYAVPAAVAPAGLGVLPFLLGATGYLWLLLAEGRDRVQGWGRSLRVTSLTPVSRRGEHDAGVDAPFGMTGRRVGAAALAVGLAVPVLLPALHPLVRSDGNGTGVLTGTGSSGTAVSAVVSLRAELRQEKTSDMLHYTTNDPDPDYLRLTALDHFDGDSWVASKLEGDKSTRVSRGIPSAAGLSTAVARRTVTHSFTAVDLDSLWLPVPYPATTAKVKGDWRYSAPTGTIWSKHTSTRHLSWKTTSLSIAPTAEQLVAAGNIRPSAAMAPYLQLPRLPALVTSTVTQIISQAKATSAEDKAVAIQNWLRGKDFTYDVSVPLTNDSNSLVRFLRTKRGFCEQFAATMAVFARTQNIPARVAIGFTAGTKQSDGSRIVTSHDAHAWPELYFAGVGWLRFEPSPIAGTGGSAQPPRYAVSSPTGASRGTTGQAAADPNKQGRLNRQLALPDRGTQDAFQSHPEAVSRATSSGRGPWLMALPVLAVLAFLPAAVGIVTRRRRWHSVRSPAGAAQVAWLELRDAARDFGQPWSPSWSPRTAGHRLIDSGRLPAAAAAGVSAIVASVENSRYARTALAADGLAEHAADVRAALRARASWPARARAWLLPSVAKDGFRQAGAVIADGLDGLDRVVSRVSSRLRVRRA